MKDSVKKFCNEVKDTIKHLNKNINYIHNKSDKFRIVIFFDILWCIIKYGISDNEYRIFEFYLITKEKRKTYLSIDKHNSLNKKLYNKKISNVLEDKKIFGRRFKEYINYDVINIKDLNFKSFEDFALKNKTIIAKSSTNSFVKTYKIYDLKDYRSPAFMSDQINKDNLSMLFKKVSQAKQLNTINDLVVVNVTSIYNNGCNIISSNLKYKENNKIITGFIDCKTGKIKGNFKDEKGISITNQFDGFAIPNYEKVLDMTKKLSKELEEIKEIEWSFLIGNKTVYLVDANKWEDFVFAQTPEFLKNRIGLLPIYNKLVK